MEETLKEILGLVDTAGPDQVVEAVRALKREQTAKSTSGEYQNRIKGLMNIANMSHENAVLAIQLQDTEKARQEAEEAERAKRQAKAPAKGKGEPVGARF